MLSLSWSTFGIVIGIAAALIAAALAIRRLN